MPIQTSDLQKLMQEPSGTVRAEIAQKVAKSFTAGEFNTSEKNIAADVYPLYF